MSTWDQNEQKTEAPTPRREEQAREKGQVHSSADLIVGLKLLAVTWILGQWGPSVVAPLMDLFPEHLRAVPELTPQPAVLRSLASRVVLSMANSLGTIWSLVTCIILVTSLTQTGFNISLHPLAPDFGRLSWAKGWERLLSRRAQVRAGFSILKFALLSAVAAWLLMRAWPVPSGGNHLAARAVSAWELTIKTCWAMSLTLVALGALDYIFQRFQHTQDLRMTRQEVKDDLKQTDGDPQIRARIRKLQRERSRRKMLSDVPRATVVIRNPTHYAVALRYDRGQDSAPVVVAKGADYLALRILEIAREHDVPIVERRETARAIFAMVEVGQEIPSRLFFAVAEVLNYVYKLRGRI